MTLNTAVELADRENARLTIAKTCDSAGGYVWVNPFGSCAAYIDPLSESPDQACRAVAQMARSVPNGIPVTTLVLNQSTEKGLVKLISSGHFGAVVAQATLFARCKRLRRLLTVQEILSVPVVPPNAMCRPARPFPSGSGSP